MKIVSRTLSFFLILQLLALSGIPPVRVESGTYRESSQLKSGKEASSEVGLLGQFSGFNKDEQTEITEDDVENDNSFHGVACFFGQTESHKNLILNVQSNLSDVSLLYVRISLFLLYHCWKIDLLEV